VDAIAPRDEQGAVAREPSEPDVTAGFAGPRAQPLHAIDPEELTLPPHGGSEHARVGA